MGRPLKRVSTRRWVDLPPDLEHRINLYRRSLHGMSGTRPDFDQTFRQLLSMALTNLGYPDEGRKQR